MSTMGFEKAAAVFMDRDQALHQIEKGEAVLKEGRTKGRPREEAEQSLKIARSLFRLGLFQKAYMFATRARQIMAEEALAGP